jgi:signal transduction histidine kinase/CheY-like chemotaxis protein/HPt (histidine-containing phosphotransfer) domain-containing protein
MLESQPCGTPSVAFWKDKLAKIRDDGYVSYQFVDKKRNGDILYTDVVGMKIKMNDRIVLATYSNDVTKMVLSQKAAENAMERTKLMFDATPLLIEFWNRQNEIIDNNPFVMKLFDLKSKEEYISRFDEFLPRLQPDGTPSWTYVVRHLKQVFNEGYSAFDMVLSDGNGDPIYTEVVGIRMMLNDETVAVTYSNDVTRVKKSMEQIKAAEERTQLMLDGNPVACYLISQDFVIIDCNKEAVKLFKFANKNEAIENSKEIFMRRDFDAFMKHFDAALDEEFKTFEWVLDTGRGPDIPCDISFVRVTLEDKYVIAVYLQDMTAIKQMLEQKEKTQIAEENSQAKSKFLASMSHEIRTPITAVLGIAEIQMKNPDLPLDLEEAFAKIYDSGSILLNIINDILDISKIEAGKMDLIIDTYEVSSLAIDTIQMHLVYLGSKRIKFLVNADENMPAYLVGDELRIKQIMNNVLSNAFKYTDVGKVTLDLYCNYRDGNQSPGAITDLVVRVADTGKGMNEQQLAALQDEYTRFHEKEARFTQGTGLGMPIVYNMVKLMGGTIEVKSEVGMGTSITITLPQEISGNEKLGHETVENLQQFEKGVLSNTKKMNFTPEPMPYGKVLVVDDVETNLYVAKGLMGFYDLTIETASGGYEAIEIIKGGKVYDIIFMDHMMPDINGIDTVKIIRQLGYTQPIVALTANALIGQAEEFMKNGFDGFISKPIQTMHLNTMLNKFIRDKQPPEVLEAARNTAKKDVPVKEEAGGNGGLDDFYKRSDIADKLRKEFLRTQKNVIQEITTAVEENKLEVAHRLSHTLKGLAGLIGEKQLVDLAFKAETTFKEGKIPTEMFGDLTKETESVLDKIATQYKGELAASDNPDANFDKDKAKELFDKLEKLLSEDSPDAMDLVDDLTKIPGTKEMVTHIEDFEFAAALEDLGRIRPELGI